MAHLSDILKRDETKLLTGHAKIGQKDVECFFWYVDSELFWVVNLMNDDTVDDIPDDVLKALFDSFDAMYQNNVAQGDETYTLTTGYHGQTPIKSYMFLLTTCPECSGRGTIETSVEDTCYSCAGMGCDEDGDECDTCGGSGYVEFSEDADCVRCNGFGDAERDVVSYYDIV